MNTKQEREINITAAQDMNLKIFAEAFENGSITEKKYKELVQMTLEQTKAELAKLG